MNPPLILTINGGSSSLKFGLFEKAAANPTQTPRLLGSGKVERIGNPPSLFSVSSGPWGEACSREVAAADPRAAVQGLLDQLNALGLLERIQVVGHRIVHGGSRFIAPALVCEEMLAELARISPFDPNHIPGHIALIRAMQSCLPNVPQVACFDTAFHQPMPDVAKWLPLPRKYYEAGVRRYGFHGLSYEYLLDELARVAGPQKAKGKIILAHLGSGSSMAAVSGGKPIDTTMGFTPTAGLVMGTRTGDIDPGLVLYLAQSENMSAERFNTMVNKESGLLGVSRISGDVRDLLTRESTEIPAAEALRLFCYSARKTIGALTAALGGLDGLVFSAGIGERSPIIRERICEGLQYLGLHLDPQANSTNSQIISRPDSPVTVWVIPTDEESIIARTASKLIP